MTELGEHLKRARLEKDLSLEDIQAMTKIQKRYLQSIENGQYQQLPGSFYTRAFVKSYAEAVGLNPETLFEEYGHELPKVTPKVESLPPRQSRTSVSPPRGKIWSILPGLLVFLLVIGLVAVIWVLAIKGNEDKAPENASDHDQNVEFQTNEDAVSDDKGNENDPGSDQSEESSNEKENQQNQQQEETTEQNGELKLTDRSGDTSNFTLTETNQFKVAFTFTGESWLKIEGNSGEMYVNEGFSKEEETTFDFSEESGVRIRIGNVPSMSMTVNGEEVVLETSPVTQTVKITFEK